MTEEEAKTKWCPFARVAAPITQVGTDKVVGVSSANRLGLSEKIAITGSTDRSNPESSRCIGSACMAWRRLEHPEYDQDVQRQYSSNSLEEIGQMKLSAGFCGLAGRP